MAQKSFANPKGDRFLTTVVIGFAAVIVSLVVGLVIYNIFNVEYSYDEFDHITSFYAIDAMPEDTYLVYFYSEYCSHCNDIKQDVLKFAAKNDQNIKIYFLDSSYATGTDRIVMDPVTDADLSGTPTIVTVVNGVITHVNPGSDVVLDVLDAINDGTYDYE